MALIALVAMVTVSSVAFAQSSAVTVGATVGSATTISTNCWEWGLAASWNWYSDGTINLTQPAVKGDAPEDGDPADGQDANWGAVTGTEQYDALGGNPDSSLTGEDSNAFGYGDCKVAVSTSDLTWDIALTADAFDNAGATADIDDMAGAATAGFDMDLDNGAGYAATDEEHGFYVLGDTATIGALVNSDDGTAFVQTYDTAKDFDALSCGAGLEPCYHGLEAAVGQQLYDDTSAGLSSEEFITRFGVGVDAATAADTYSMTATYTITI